MRWCLVWNRMDSITLFSCLKFIRIDIIIERLFLYMMELSFIRIMILLHKFCSSKLSISNYNVILPIDILSSISVFPFQYFSLLFFPPNLSFFFFFLEGWGWEGIYVCINFKGFQRLRIFLSK